MEQTVFYIQLMYQTSKQKIVIEIFFLMTGKPILFISLYNLGNHYVYL